ncbi:sensor histidine kinase [Paraglaciecola hydrolytica]|uniref:Histidine kinase n=1 Tax=Paraglaciecola hydrolytica TaxID=1799789 RepID=A0A148KL21_9ALTE|nr:histidine kinase [Paraglaciecola hydrolytica]KXI27003.1 histidine kinase [Paraglaciecola hydrolytica]
MNNSVQSYFNQQHKPSFYLLHSLGWAAYVLIFFTDNLFFFKDFNKLGLNVFFPLVLAGLSAALLTWPLRHVYRRCWKLPALWLIVTIVSSSLLVAIIWTPIKNLAIWYFYEGFDVWGFLQGQDVDPSFRWYMLFMSISYAFFMILVWSSLYFGINYHYRLVSEKQMHLDALRLSHVAQIKMLRYQINPHFLFNTLNAISTLVLRGDKEKANGMLTRLSTFLRFSLDNDPEKKIRLYEELKALMLYLEIEKTRFDERLTVKFKVEPQAESLLVPSLLLQPLVENSIKYAIAQMATGGLISISAFCKNNSLHLEVADNGPSVDNEADNFVKQNYHHTQHSGVGVQNIIERLKVLYPDQHQFQVSKEKRQGYKVKIVIPMEQP